MIQSYDVGSLPFTCDHEKFSEGVARYVTSIDYDLRYFERTVIGRFLDKVKAGIDVPNYPQLRDMNKMFLEMINGVKKTKSGYMETDVLSLKKGTEQIPEVAVIRKRSQEIDEEMGKPARLKVCITGPYTLASSFAYKDKEIFGRIGNVLSQILENNLFSEKHARVDLFSLDEPVFGLLDDPLMDHGSEGRDNLRESWESIFHKALSKGVQTCMHLHDTADELFWEAKSLKVVESHLDDPLYQANKTREHLESTDKFLKASVCTTDFDKLIKNEVTAAWKGEVSETTVNQRVADVWKEINGGKLDPAKLLESARSMKAHLGEVLEKFGVERVPYAGPECGFGGFPTYQCAIECLRRVSETTRNPKAWNQNSL